jgi:hypothetical protein
MSRFATLKRSDGGLQLWACRDYQTADPYTGDPHPTLVSTAQVSTTFDYPSYPLSAFAPYPPAEPIVAIAAGNFSGGGGQLWAQGFTAAGTVALFTITCDANDVWDAQWQPFLDQPVMVMPVVGPAPNGGLQIWCIDAQFTLWTSSSPSNTPGGTWSAWTKVASTPPAVPFAVCTFPDNLQQFWGRTSGYSSPEAFISSWQVQGGAWSAWQNPFLPLHTPIKYDIQAAAATQLSENAQLWALANGVLYTALSAKNAAPAAAWATSTWSPVTSIAAEGFIEDFTVARPATSEIPATYGPVQLWIITLHSPIPAAILTAQLDVITNQLGTWEFDPGLTWPWP